MRKNVLIVALALVLALVSCAEHECTWDEGKVTLEPTCTEAGEMTYTCTGCGATRTESIAALGHEWNDGETTTEATCEKEGVKTFTCTVCKATRIETIEKVAHNLGEDYKCSMCGNYFYPSLAEFNSKVTLENSKGVVVTVKLGDEKFGDISYSENSSGYTGKGLWIGRAIDDSPLNKYGKTPEEKGLYKYVFEGGTITSSSTGYESIDGLKDTSVYMLVPSNSDIVFDGVTFEGVFSFDVQMYTSPWSFLNSITFKNCTFNGIVVGTVPAYSATFEGCTFNSYANSTSANNSNPIWWRAGAGDWSSAGIEMSVTLQSLNFINNKVYGSRPVKFERIGLWSTGNKIPYTPEIKILDNYFDISCENSADYKEVEGASVKKDEEKHMAINIGQHSNKSFFTLYDDGNTISEGTKSLYTAALSSGSNQYIEVSGTKILDRNGNPKEIEALVWKTSTGETFTMKSID